MSKVKVLTALGVACVLIGMSSRYNVAEGREEEAEQLSNVVDWDDQAATSATGSTSS